MCAVQGATTTGRNKNEATAGPHQLELDETVAAGRKLSTSWPERDVSVVGIGPMLYENDRLNPGVLHMAALEKTWVGDAWEGRGRPGRQGADLRAGRGFTYAHCGTESRHSRAAGVQ